MLIYLIWRSLIHAEFICKLFGFVFSIYLGDDWKLHSIERDFGNWRDIVNFIEDRKGFIELRGFEDFWRKIREENIIKTPIGKDIKFIHSVFECWECIEGIFKYLCEKEMNLLQITDPLIKGFLSILDILQSKSNWPRFVLKSSFKEILLIFNF